MRTITIDGGLYAAMDIAAAYLLHHGLAVAWEHDQANGNYRAVEQPQPYAAARQLLADGRPGRRPNRKDAA